jgi:hypothetical protein
MQTSSCMGSQTLLLGIFSASISECRPERRLSRIEDNRKQSAKSQNGIPGNSSAGIPVADLFGVDHYGAV